MTFKEKLQIEHPDCMDESYEAGCSMCPSCYGYESYDDSEKNCLSNDGKGCDYCWNREIPEEEKDGKHMKMDTFSKADLKDGMVVEHRNGDKALFLGDLFIDELDSCDIDDFQDNLETITHDCDIDYDFDIMKIYTINRHKKYPGFQDILNDKTNEYLDLIWERKEPEKETNSDNVYEEKLIYEELYEKLENYCNSQHECANCAIKNTSCYCRKTSKKELKRLWNIIQEAQASVEDD